VILMQRAWHHNSNTLNLVFEIFLKEVEFFLKEVERIKTIWLSGHYQSKKHTVVMQYGT